VAEFGLAEWLVWRVDRRVQCNSVFPYLMELMTSRLSAGSQVGPDLESVPSKNSPQGGRKRRILEIKVGRVLD
jgi:hypothetical protein